MILNVFLIINFITYILTLKIFFYIFKTKYYFPFRYADFFNFLFNLIIFVGLSLFYFKDFFWIVFFLNLNLFYILFHLINMIITSPRTKIIIDLMESKKKQLNLIQYLKIYSCKKIVENRIKRLKTSKQITEKNNFIKLSKEKKKFFYLIVLIFSFLEKI